MQQRLVRPLLKADGDLRGRRRLVREPEPDGEIAHETEQPLVAAADRNEHPHRAATISDPFATRQGLNTYSGALGFCPLKQQLPSMFGRYGLLKLLSPLGSVPTFARPLMRASTRSRACSTYRSSRSMSQPTNWRFQYTTLPAINTSRT